MTDMVDRWGKGWLFHVAIPLPRWRWVRAKVQASENAAPARANVDNSSIFPAARREILKRTSGDAINVNILNSGCRDWLRFYLGHQSSLRSSKISGPSTILPRYGSTLDRSISPPFWIEICGWNSGKSHDAPASLARL